MCGENRYSEPPALFIDGSSPRVRGKRHTLRQRPADQRLIPACAGKTHPRLGPAPMIWAHPRVCGENYGTDFSRRTPAGSSPRVRGKPPGGRCGRGARGLIPACAGKTHLGRLLSLLPRAHPRVCGENQEGAAESGALGGSSPRVRGKRCGAHGGRPHAGLIPACAGKTGRTRAT